MINYCIDGKIIVLQQTTSVCVCVCLQQSAVHIVYYIFPPPPQ